MGEDTKDRILVFYVKRKIRFIFYFSYILIIRLSVYSKSILMPKFSFKEMCKEGGIVIYLYWQWQ